MGTVRVLILWLLLNSFHTAIAAVAIPYSPDQSEKVERQDITNPNQPQYSNLIAVKQPARTAMGYEPDIRFFHGPAMPGASVLCTCRNTVALLYLRSSSDIPLKFRSHEIALNFHSFP